MAEWFSLSLQKVQVAFSTGANSLAVLGTALEVLPFGRLLYCRREVGTSIDTRCDVYWAIYAISKTRQICD